jgi:hypothetical protein|tara:strand:+ start:114 stop:278 length:165 start_codon:yes stop_codon:yes gene_type:complete
MLKIPKEMPSNIVSLITLLMSHFMDRSLNQIHGLEGKEEAKPSETPATTSFSPK